MKPYYKTIRKQTENPFLNLYEMDAVNTEGKDFHYYFATRKEEADLVCRTGITKPDGAVIYAVTQEEQPRIVLIRQYRYPLNFSLYELPAGLIDGEETPEQAAIREMREETGLELKIYLGGNPAARRAFYQAQGLCDESNVVIYGTVALDERLQGTHKTQLFSSGTEASEDISVVIADKIEACRILSEEQVSMRCAYLLMHFLQMKAETPFAFLDMDVL